MAARAPCAAGCPLSDDAAKAWLLDRPFVESEVRALLLRGGLLEDPDDPLTDVPASWLAFTVGQRTAARHAPLTQAVNEGLVHHCQWLHENQAATEDQVRTTAVRRPAVGGRRGGWGFFSSCVAFWFCACVCPVAVPCCAVP